MTPAIEVAIRVQNGPGAAVEGGEAVQLEVAFRKARAISTAPPRPGRERKPQISFGVP